MVNAAILLLAVQALAAAGPPPDPGPVEAVADALASGASAERTGDPDQLLAAARTLDALGAKAAEGTDAATRWRMLAAGRSRRDATPPYRGRALGPAYRQGILDPRGTLATEQVFLAGQRAIVAVVPEAGKTLAIHIRSEGASICDRMIAPPHGGCAWLPMFTRRVEIRLTNPGEQPVHYYLVSN